jgi:hypothetical protein
MFDVSYFRVPIEYQAVGIHRMKSPVFRKIIKF